MIPVFSFSSNDLIDVAPIVVEESSDKVASNTTLPALKRKFDENEKGIM